MRIPLDWLGEYVELPAGVTGAEVAASLVRVGLEEEGLHGGEVTGPLVVGRVLTAEPEPQKNGKTINWCTVDVADANGSGQPQGIVCGAHNFGVGDLVVVALPGAELPGGFAIAARKTYGHVSAGMICAADELGLPDDGSGGVIVLSDDSDSQAPKPGDDAIALLGLDRETVEINVTPDRGYCFSLRGVAREYALSTGAAYTDPAAALAAAAPAANADGFPVEVRDDAPLRGKVGCDRFVARVVRGIDPSAPTPPWMARWLTEAGMRPISLPVDVTNFVMLALGQPTHAYDLSTIERIVVRRARPGESIVTLDGTQRSLFEQDLLITDGGDRPIGIAGVMGGESTEVTESTTDVLIEAAHFDQVTVARSARRHRLPSEASRRFERGVDPDLGAAAAEWIVRLLVEYAGGTADPGVTDDGGVATPGPIAFEPASAGRLVGIDYTDDQVEQVLREVGCSIDTTVRPWQVTPPTWRPDLHTGPDLIEEVARTVGYDAIPSVLPTPPGGRGLTPAQHARRTVADMLAARGLTEVWSAPFVSDDRHAALGYDPAQVRKRTVALVNPLSEEQPLMRASILSTLVDALRRNVARGFKDVALFETGLVVSLSAPQAKAPGSPVGVHPEPALLQRIRDAVPTQPRHVGVLMTGQVDRAGWWGAGRPADWSDAVQVVRDLAEALSVDLEVSADADTPPFHPGRCAAFALADGTVIGHAGELHPKVVQQLGLPARTVGAEVDLDALIGAAGPAVSAPISTYPLATSDVALVVDDAVPAARVDAALREGAGELLESLALFDAYTGDQAGGGKRSLAYRLTFRAPERTLTTEEVNAARDAAVTAAHARTGAVQRT